MSHKRQLSLIKKSQTSKYIGIKIYLKQILNNILKNCPEGESDPLFLHEPTPTPEAQKRLKLGLLDSDFTALPCTTHMFDKYFCQVSLRL